MMTQNRLPFQYEITKVEKNLTSFGGLPLYMELANVTGLMAKIKESMQIKIRGWKDEQLISSVILLNLAGGDCLEDIQRLEKDEGLSRLLLKIETHGMARRERREKPGTGSRFTKKMGRESPSKLSKNGQKFVLCRIFYVIKTMHRT